MRFQFSKKQKMTGSACLVLGLLTTLIGCGKMTQNTIGDASRYDNPLAGNALYQSYQKQFPENLTEMTPEDFMARLPAHKLIMANGEVKEIYTTAEVFYEVALRVEESVPTYNPEVYANQLVEIMIQTDPAFTNMVANSAAEPDPSKITMTEEEFKQKILDDLKTKETRIGAEKNFMIASELAKPDVQARIQSSVARIQNNINTAKSLGQAGKSSPGDGFNKHEQHLLFANPQYAVATAYTYVSTPQWTKQAFGEALDKTRSNAYQHSMFNARLASIPMQINSRSGCLWWAKAMSDAHEMTDDGNWESDGGQMDLQNNSVGRRLFYENTKGRELRMRIKVGRWKIVDVVYAVVTQYISGSNINTISNTLISKAKQEAIYARYVAPNWIRRSNDTIFTPNDTQLVYLDISTSGDGHSGSGSGNDYPTPNITK